MLGITGTGGSGKSSLTDELVRRFRLDQEDKLRIAVLAVDPTRRKGGGALLGDRIRMNSIDGDGTSAAVAPAARPRAGAGVGGGRVFFRSFATRGSGSELPDCLDDAIAACRAAGFDLVIVETPGIGQGDAAVVPHVDFSLYVMTPEFGAASQLEKIDMLDFAGAVAINKFERRGGEDALRDVRRQLARTGEHPGVALEELPVFGTVASRFNDDGVTALYQYLRDAPGQFRPAAASRPPPVVAGRTSTRGAGHRPAGPRPLPGRHRRDRAGLPPATDDGGRPPPAGASSCATSAALLARPRAAGRRPSRELAARAELGL